MGFINLLVNKGLLAAEDVSKVEETSRKTGETFEDILLKIGLNQEDIITAKSEFFGIPARAVDDKAAATALKYIPEESAKNYNIIPIGLRDGVLEVGMVDPDNIEARDALTFISSKNNLPFKIFLISKADFEKTVANYKGLTGEIEKALNELGTDFGTVEIDPNAEEGRALGDETTIIEDAPITKVVNNIIYYATQGKVSDVHIEPMRNRLRVRYRVDGVLNTSLVLPGASHQQVISNIKVKANIKLDEKRKPQDGRFSSTIDGRKVSFRVSTFPTYYGEKVVMRILDQERAARPLTEVVDNPDMLKAIKEAIQRPYGLILISGPTGSGKTTTLYSMLKELNSEELNILSLEDPIEYNIEGVSQSQVFPDIGYDFANGLRTTLRQDPDVIMVGEIRDKETAKLAVQAALTGHLVLSTIHTNTAIGVIPRLVDMGVDPYLIAPTLILAMSQRLVRNIYPGTGKPIQIDSELRVNLEKGFSDLPAEVKAKIKIPDTVLQIAPSALSPTGTQGRSAAFEFLLMDRDIEKMITKNPTESEIYDVMRKKGMITMKEDALMKAFRGEIPYEEVSRVFGLMDVEDLGEIEGKA